MQCPALPLQPYTPVIHDQELRLRGWVRVPSSPCLRHLHGLGVGTPTEMSLGLQSTSHPVRLFKIYSHLQRIFT